MRLVLLCLAVSVGLAGCGKKGDIAPAEGQTKEYPRTYPPKS